jgi:AraC-like DNA-binding protein
MPRRQAKADHLSLSDRVDSAALTQRRAVPRQVRRFRLPIEQLRPVVRIAHKITGTLLIGSRFIPDFEIVLLTRGRSVCTAKGVAHALKPGDVLLIPPFVEHTFTESTPGTQHIAVHFDLSPDVPGTRIGARSRAYQVELSHGWSSTSSSVWSAGHEVIATLERVVEVFNRRTPSGDLECSCLVGAVLARLFGRTMTQEDSEATNAWRLRALLAHIESHLDQPLEAAELATVAGLSESRLRAVFKRQMGVSPKRYIRQRRVALAQRLLADPTLSLKEIARKSGFADEFHFSKSFRAIDGIPPSSYRQQALASRF